MHEVKIYGEIAHTTQKSDTNNTLSDVQNQLLAANGEDVKVRISSDGGDVNEGFAIYYELRRYAKENNAKIHTFAESRLSSIATVIFLAGDERELSSDLTPFVHKAYVDTDQELSPEDQKHLSDINNRIAKHYSDHTELTFEEALDLMGNETYISPEMAKNMRFATSIEEVLRPVALKRFELNININNNQMNKSKSILNKVAQFLKIFENKMIATADGGELDFYELDDNAVIEVGTMANYNGEPAIGSFVLNSGETYVFDSGVLTEIAPADDIENNDNATVSALETENEELIAKLEEITNKAIELDTQNKAKALIISNYQNSKSKSAPVLAKDNLVKQEVKESKAGILSEKIKNIQNIKTK